MVLRCDVQCVTAGANPVSVKKGIEKTNEYLVGKLREHAKPVQGRNDIKNVASISSGNDESVGEMIADALDKVGSNGVLSIEGSNSIDTFVEVTEGMEIDRGYISPQFVNNQERLLVEYDNCRVLITDQKVGWIGLSSSDGWGTPCTTYLSQQTAVCLLFLACEQHV